MSTESGSERWGNLASTFRTGVDSAALAIAVRPQLFDLPGWARRSVRDHQGQRSQAAPDQATTHPQADPGSVPATEGAEAGEPQARRHRRLGSPRGLLGPGARILREVPRELDGFIVPDERLNPDAEGWLSATPSDPQAPAT